MICSILYRIACPLSIRELHFRPPDLQIFLWQGPLCVKTLRPWGGKGRRGRGPGGPFRPVPYSGPSARSVYSARPQENVPDGLMLTGTLTQPM